MFAADAQNFAALFSACCNAGWILEIWDRVEQLDLLVFDDRLFELCGVQTVALPIELYP